jgi:hypothetical protein
MRLLSNFLVEEMVNNLLMMRRWNIHFKTFGKQAVLALLTVLAGI